MRPAIALQFLAAAALAIAAGCANTRVEQQWTHPDYTGRRLTGKVMVVGVTLDPAFRRRYEDALSARLAARGLVAQPSYTLVPARFTDMSEGALIEAARREGMETLMVSFVVDHERITVAPPAPPASAQGGLYEGWYGHYWPYLARAPEAPRVVDRYIAETLAFDVPGRSLRWTARTRTDASGNALADIDRFAAAIVRALVTAGLA